MKPDEDEMQEYHCLLLEGHDEMEARRLARAANDKINSRRLSGPTTGDTRKGHGQRPLVSDMTYSFYWENVRSIGIDDRTPEERSEADEAIRRVEQVLNRCAPKQRQFLIHKYGIGVEPAVSVVELAERLGVSKGTAQSTLQKLRAKLTA